jgi:hypothetical protein
MDKVQANFVVSEMNIHLLVLKYSVSHSWQPYAIADISYQDRKTETLCHPVLSVSYDEFILAMYLVNDTNMFL